MCSSDLGVYEIWNLMACLLPLAEVSLALIAQVGMFRHRDMQPTLLNMVLSINSRFGHDDERGTAKHKLDRIVTAAQLGIIGIFFLFPMAMWVAWVFQIHPVVWVVEVTSSVLNVREYPCKLLRHFLQYLTKPNILKTIERRVLVWA